MKAEFEEKTFEVAANNEFQFLGATYTCPACGGTHCVYCGARHRAPTVDIWAPGQVIESVLGFDVLVDLQGNVEEIEALIGRALPTGMQWKPHFGNPAQVGSAPDWASLFLQYKRPERITRRRGKFTNLFEGEYYRFDLDAEQHQTLATFAAATAGDAVVCYAAPRFYTNADMLWYRQQRLVLSRTVFIDTGADADHRYGAYDEHHAVLCSEPEQVRAVGLPGLIAAVRRLNRGAGDGPVPDLSAHLTLLASGLRTQTSQDTTPSPTDIGDIIRRILNFTDQHDLTWLIARTQPSPS